MASDSLVIGGVIGDVIEPFTPSVSLRISFNGRVFSVGRDLKAYQVANRPRVEIGGEDLRTFYTMVLVDPDAPSPSDPYQREYLHWLVTDIPGSTSADFGREVTSYESPQPSMGIHRLVFVLFRQHGGRQSVNISCATERRENFLTREFANNNQLGQPVAAMYYNCQRDNGTGGRRFGAT